MTVKTDMVRHSRRSMLQMAVAGSMLMLSATAVMSQEVTLNFWDMVWGGTEYPAVAQKLVDRYNKENPDVNVVYRAVPWTNWYETFVTAVAAGSAPDLSTGGGYQAVQLYSQGAIMPVDELVAKMNASEFAPGTLDAMKYDGHYMGVPWALSPDVLWYRKDLLAEAGIKVPTNWDELRAAARALTKDGKYGIASSGDTNGAHWLLHFAVGNGGGLFDKEGDAAISSERTMEAFQYLSDLVADGSVNPASVGYTGADARGALYRGEVAFYLGTAAVANRAGDAKDQLGIVPPLAGPHGDVAGSCSVNNIMVYNQTQHKDETFAFLKWWSENALPLFTEGMVGDLPARVSIANDDHFTSDKNLTYVLNDIVPVAKLMSEHKGGTFPALNAVDGDGFLFSLIQSIWQGQPLKGPAATAQAHLEDIVKSQ
ncbi:MULTISPECIES: ABC transporter substrate-binding protein [unclassified Rhizobium]|uniref:ABC transporter substrate-binding protein n=1 Tax=unclassified Rhizobium TaxID=2613769 RepID=UPI001AD9F9C8|nr:MULTISPECIES: sugar ABC transporter substrate-binding protein [unclassified Rhizobium]MBO9127748.1 sugar ABC transporter substrate-binding protein [Rhizobium sp. 16-488-2b]MBO9178210.1 sugar ABC transporter substrate-binding protein [Rhizobium sp. 16-488-2a]